jgi:L-cysteine:1D-myo-inositol 2-amino-2-deoxy-alpha-D-glucopyranoside ligase
MVLAMRETALFREDMEALRVLPPRHFIGAVEAIPEIAELVGKLLASGAAYRLDDPEFPDVYFDISATREFGYESGYDTETMLKLSGERGGDPERPGKRNPLDALLWRMAREGEPAWDSDLGRGRPGWHVECTAIALEYLDPPLAVQGGGRDLVFPHHEMCAAQGAVLTGGPFARSYVHAGMVAYDGEKMSKSRGNLVFVSVLLRDGVDPMVIRLALLAHHYRSDWEYTSADLDAAAARLEIWRAATALSSGPAADAALATVRERLGDDLDAPGALIAIDDWAASALGTGGGDAAAPELVRAIADVLLGIAL